MIPRLRFLVRYLAFWTAFFVFGRLLFLAWEHAHTATLSAWTVARVVGHGLRMDLSAAAYLSVVPGLLLAASAFIPPAFVRRAISAWTVALSVIMASIIVVDLGIWDAWGYHLDLTVYEYLRTPREAFASAQSSPLLVLSLILVAFTAAATLAYRRVFAPLLATIPSRHVTGAVATLGATLLLVVLMRGGLQWTPLNPSTVYFASDDFANRAALNVPWNLIYSFTIAPARQTTNPYGDPPEEEARAILDSLTHAGDQGSRNLLRVSRPNVVLIIWESLTAKVVAAEGGMSGVTPHLDSLVHEGVLFDSLYASEERSAQALVAILSGFPEPPHVQIMHTPERAARLPSLSHDLGGAGYATSFYYGGELAFADIQSYVRSSEYRRVVGGDAFPKDQRQSKWGAQDEFVLARLAKDLGTEARPFFATLFTLSSHEPFDVPMAPVFPGDGIEDKFLNAQAYTDRSVGAFIRTARQQPWWDSTLVVIVADHGHPLPALSATAGTAADDVHRIPMLWLGGALAVRDTVVHRIASQADLAPTLLAQLGVSGGPYLWGNDLLDPRTPAFAYYTHMNGFGFVDRHGSLTYDVAGGRVTDRSGNVGDAQVRAGRAILRLTFQSYLDLAAR